MAINIEWQVNPPSKGKEEEKTQMFPRITDSEVVSEQRLTELMADRGSLSKGNAKMAISDLVEVMAELLREGKTIDIPMLGSFKLSIGTDAQIYPDSERRMRRIMVRGVNFQPDPQFIESIGKPNFRWKSTPEVTVTSTTSQLIPLLTDYFKTHDSFTRTEFEHMFGLKRSTAYNRLKELIDEGVLRAVGNGRETKYVKGNR